MNMISYQPHPMCRWHSLFGDHPQATFDADRLMRAVQSSVRFDSVARGIEDTRYSHNLLHIIQHEILRDAAILAFSRQVTALKEAHEKERVPALAAVRAERLREIEPLRERMQAFRKECEIAVNRCYAEDTATWRERQEVHRLEVERLQQELAVATTFAAETGLPIDPETALIPQRIEQLVLSKEEEHSRRCREREHIVTTLKQASEGTIQTIWAEYRRESEAAQQSFETALKQAHRELQEAIQALQASYEAKLQDARAQIDAIYAPFYAAENALQEAATAFAAQMKSVRADSAQALSAGISGFFTAATPTENEATPDTTGSA